jgi:four helix bundle protein
MDHFDHERLDVYRAAIDFVATANDIVEHLPRGRSYLADQLQRAATSVPLNIAEGAGEFSAQDKARFYRMAKRSATECAAVLDVCARLGLVEQERLATGRELLLRIVSMLVRMVNRTGLSGTGTGRGTGTRTDPARPLVSAQDPVVDESPTGS